MTVHRRAPRWLSLAIGGVLILALTTLLGCTPDRPELYRLVDQGGRVSVELPTSWWDATARDAGEITTDETGEWIVPDLQAAGDSPRLVSIWLDRARSERNALTGQHREFIAATCPDPLCTADPVVAVTVNGYPGQQQQGRFEDGHLAVITTINTDGWMIFVLADGEDTAASAAELIGITASILLLR